MQNIDEMLTDWNIHTCINIPIGRFKFPVCSISAVCFDFNNKRAEYVSSSRPYLFPVARDDGGGFREKINSVLLVCPRVFSTTAAARYLHGNKNISICYSARTASTQTSDLCFRVSICLSVILSVCLSIRPLAPFPNSILDSDRQRTLFLLDEFCYFHYIRRTSSVYHLGPI